MRIKDLVEKNEKLTQDLNLLAQLCREYQKEVERLEEIVEANSKTDGNRILREMKGNIVTYDIDFLLNHLSSEISLLTAYQDRKKKIDPRSVNQVKKIANNDEAELDALTRFIYGCDPVEKYNKGGEW